MGLFDVYLKEGKSFQLSFERFECKDDKFIIYDSANQETGEGFLLFDPVAAIVPRIQPRSDQIEGYRIHLKNDQHVDVHAHAFDQKHSAVKFYIRQLRTCTSPPLRLLPLHLFKVSGWAVPIR
jgi:hypothetical protein